MTTVHLNEVDLPAVGSLVRAIQGDPEIARTVWKSDDDAVDALHRKVVSTSPVGHTLIREVSVTVDLA